ncbi:Fimbrin [Oopsacas minuta]|uniref:Fimbrin n=1 Tax=Oopsacas minuta TaxID=111878 RepID=A0AAV7JFY7_9METZ|nr:Fimbrin [Oopsacas minuta]
MAVSDFTEGELSEIKTQFELYDADGNGHITCLEITNLFKALGEHVPGYEVREMIKEVDKDMNGTVEFNEFLQMYKSIKQGKKEFKLAEKGAEGVKKLVKTGGTSVASAEGTTHSFTEEEKYAFVDWINYLLVEDPDLKNLLPMNEDDDSLFTSCENGIMLCKLINTAIPGTIDERAINKGKLNQFTIVENQNLALNSAAAIGCSIQNIGAKDLMAGTHHLILGLVWQVIRIGLFSKIDLKGNPGFFRLLQEGETIQDLMKLPPDQLLIRWVNYQMDEAGHPEKHIKNFTSDIKDSEVYTYLINQVAPAGSGVDQSPLSEVDMETRASKMLNQADKIDCKKFVRPKDVVNGNKKLNMAFVANLFNTYPALDPPDDLPDFDMNDMGEKREEKTFRNWMNSLGVDPFVNNIYSDLSDGLVLLQLFDKIKPGIVEWKKVTKTFSGPSSKIKKIENCNHVIECGHKLDLKLIGIDGNDIHTENKTLCLALIWQMMRTYTLKILSSITPGKKLEDAEIVVWVNSKLEEGQKETRITSFKDASIATAIPVIDLIDCIKPGAIKYDLVFPGADEEQRMQNAKYAISMSRKIGARVYALPEDIVEVNNKMVLTIFAVLMAKAHNIKM